VGVHLAVIAAYTLPAVFLWWNAWSTGAASSVRCGCLDPGQQVWFMAWPAYALTHGLNPLSTTWLWPPHGVNLLDNASAPLVGIVFAPLTWLVGPVASTTVVLTLAPALSAWGCWVACRRFVDWRPACWVGGFLFGYSPFVVESVAQGHLSTGLLVLPPLLLVVLHEILVRQAWRASFCGVALATILFAQFLISEEVLTIMLVMSVIGVLAVAVMAPGRVVPALPFALRAMGVAALASLVLLLGPVWFALDGPEHITGSVWGGLHLFIVAQAWELWSAGPVSSPLFDGALQGPQVQFLGYGVLAVAACSLVLARRRRSMWVLAIVAIVATVFSWGGLLWLSPTHVVISSWLPWSHFTNLTVFDDISAVHFSFVADLAVAIVVAIGLDSLHQAAPWRRLPPVFRGAVVAGVVALMAVPIWGLYQAPLSVQSVDLPQWYATAALHIPEQAVVTSYPFPSSASVTSQPMVWQSVDGMRFKLAGGYIKARGSGSGVLRTGRPGSGTWTLIGLTMADRASARSFPLSPLQVTELREALRSWNTSYVVVVDRGTVPTEAAGVFTATTGELPEIVDHAWVWNLRTTPVGSAVAATTASLAFTTCRDEASDLEQTPRGRPLPQSLNSCIVSAMGT
jgi:hypothetical protein